MADYLPQPYGFSQNLTFQIATIAASASASDVIASQGKALVGLIMPAAWTAAAIQYYASVDSSSFKVVKDTTTANLMQTLVAADDWIVFPLADAIFAPYIKLVSVTATTVTPVTQNAERTIILVLRNFLD